MDEQAIKEERGVNAVLEPEFRTDMPVLVQIKIEKVEENEVGDSPNSSWQEIHSIPTFEPEGRPPMLAQLKIEKEEFSFVSIKEEYEVDEPMQRGVKIEIDIEDDSYKETISDLIFKCDYCYEEFSEKSMLERHVSVHPSTSLATNRKYECNICSHSFISSYSLDQHGVLVHKLCDKTVSTSNEKNNKKGSKITPKSNTQGEGPYKCQFCDYTSFRIGWFNVHLKRMHPTENCLLEYKCPICDHKATNSSKLKTHLMVHSDEKPYKCKHCDFACKTSSRLSAHMKRHVDDKPYECKVCDYKCKSKGSMRKHSMIHTGEKKFECNKCGRKFALNCYLTRHYRIHLEEKREKFKCDLCNYATTFKSSVKVHYKLVHMKEKRHECHLCDRRFPNNTNLVQHMRRHTGQKPYQCDICDYACVASYYLKNHMMTHTGAKPFECDYCGYKCSNKSNLMKHIRIHIGDMRYICEFCDYKSVSSCGLRKHLRKHHPRSQVVRF